MTKLPWPKIIQEYEAGHSYTRLVEKYSTTRQTIYKGLKRNNVALRGRRKGAEHQNWKGGKRVNASGYVRVWINPDSPFAVMVPKSEKSSHVLEHRLVMAEALGRPLRDDEEVHHINGDKRDNQISNLQLLVGKHGNGVAMCCKNCGSTDLVPVEIKK